VGVSIFGVLLSDWRTRQSMKLTKQDLNSKLRPRLKIDDNVFPSYVGLTNNSVLEYNEFDSKIEISEIHYVIFNRVVTNVGSLPTIAAKTRLLDSCPPFNKQKLQKEAPSHADPVMTGECFDLPFIMMKEDWINRNKNDCFIGLETEHEWDENVAKIGKIWLLEGVTNVEEY